MREAPDLGLLIEAARAAGPVAMRHFRASPRSWDKAGDQGPVSEADLEVNAVLEAHLRGARPDYGWLSEESEEDPARLTAERVFIVDPIDGTRAFLQGTSAFSHALAVVHNGVVEAAVVYLPAQERLYAAALGAGATLNGAPIHVSGAQSLTGADVLATKPTFLPDHWPGGVPDVNRAHRPSLAYRLCLVAQGRFDALVTVRDAWEWDIAAGCLIAAEAGGIATDATGAPIRFNARWPRHPGCFAAPRQIHAALMRHRGG
ncbi:inositol monophosphatase family protein [Oceanibium sediminis]|uniref:inositol monophosphatase family protein n=1 Tax=Oceanibium sediminis TaxID=2026339 RepID=UPI002157FB9F|nr:3'(2'),5'-bisphosphate nucleotidase CysQ [Oceanibium sediminis]